MDIEKKNSRKEITSDEMTKIKEAAAFFRDFCESVECAFCPMAYICGEPICTWRKRDIIEK